MRRLALVAVLAVLGAGALLAGTRGADPPADRAASYVPSGARAYLNVDTRSDGADRLRDLVERLPALQAARDRLLAGAGRRLPARSLASSDLDWVAGEAALALLGGGHWVAVVETRDRGEAESALARLVGTGVAFAHRGLRVRAAGGIAWTLSGRFAVVGSGRGVREGLDAHAGARRALGRDPLYRSLRRRLPEDRMATAWLSNAGLRGLGGAGAAVLAQLGGAAELRAAVASLSLRPGRGVVSVAAEQIPRSGCESGPLASLVDAAPAGSAGFVEAAPAACIVKDLARARGGAGSFVRRLARESGLSIERDVAPLFGDGAALILTSTDAGPALTLLVAGAAKERALDVLSRLQPALVKLLAPVRQGQAPAFEAVGLADGTPALTAAFGPGLELSYAALGGRLAVSTSLEALEEVAHGGGLGESEAVERVAGQPPSGATALIFLDLDQLLALAEQVGFTENPAYVAVRDDLQKLRSAGAVVTREEEDTTAELSFQIP